MITFYVLNDRNRDICRHTRHRFSHPLYPETPQKSEFRFANPILNKEWMTVFTKLFLSVTNLKKIDTHFNAH